MTVLDYQNELKKRDGIIAGCQVKILELEQALKWQQAKYEALERRVFGSKSEKLTAQDLQEFLPALQNVSGDVYRAPDREKPAAEATPRTRLTLEKSGGVRSQIPDHIERVEVVLLPKAVEASPAQYEKIGEAVTERLDYKPGEVFCTRYIQPKYKKIAGTDSSEDSNLGMILQQTPPSTVADKCLAEPSLIAHVLLCKYQLHLPNYRLSKYFRETCGIDLHRNLLGDWVHYGSNTLEPAYDAMARHVFSSRYLQIDETPAKYLDPEIKGKTGTGQLWIYGIPGGEIIFQWRTDRSRKGPETMLKNFHGVVQSDRYNAYVSLEKLRPDLVFAACWAHVRRKFFEAKDHDPNAGWFLAKIGELYQIERDLRENKASWAQRYDMRQEKVSAIMEQMREQLELALPKALPQSHFGKAVLYTHKNWKQLQVYVRDGQIEIDNNLCENAIRPTAIGKKNWLFIGSPTAGDRSAIIYSLIGSCQRLGINPHEYLTDILTRLPSLKIKGVQELESFTPSGWLRARN